MSPKISSEFPVLFEVTLSTLLTAVAVSSFSINVVEAIRVVEDEGEDVFVKGDCVDG